MSPPHMNHPIPDFLDNFLTRYVQHQLSPQDLKTFFEFSMETAWDQFFEILARIRFVERQESKLLKIYSPYPYFRPISVTGERCALHCEHCDHHYLHDMIPAESAAMLTQVLQQIADEGGIGALISGGCTADGQVPWFQFASVLADLRQKTNIYLNSHVGLIDTNQSQIVKASGIDMVSFDLILDPVVIFDIFHLPHTPKDYQQVYETLKKVGVQVVPHVLIGARFGNLDAELKTIQYLAHDPPPIVIFIIMIPPHQPVSSQFDATISQKDSSSDISPFRLISSWEVAKIITLAHYLLPKTELALGCMRPKGSWSFTSERWAIQAGITRMEIPCGRTRKWLAQNNFILKYYGACCGIDSSFEKRAELDGISGNLLSKKKASHSVSAELQSELKNT